MKHYGISGTTLAFLLFRHHLKMSQLTYLSTYLKQPQRRYFCTHELSGNK